jgi:hypothetical protein
VKTTNQPIKEGVLWHPFLRVEKSTRMQEMLAFLAEKIFVHINVHKNLPVGKKNMLLDEQHTVLF